MDDPVNLYFAEVGKVPQLTASEESECIHLILAGGERRESAEKRLMEANLWLVVAIAQRYPHSGIHVLDLIESGNRGLLAAVERLCEGRPDNFRVYATPFIEGAIAELAASPGGTGSP